MAVVRNHFEKELTDTSISSVTITGLTAEYSTVSVNCNIESTLYLLRSVYKTLIDAGYTDVIKNEDEYSISVLGFKFFPSVSNYGGDIVSGRNCTYINVYSYSNNSITYVASTGNNNSYKTIITQDISKISFDIIVRGDNNCVYISYIPSLYPLLEYPILFIAKAKNLITSENAFFYCSGLGYNNYKHAFVRNKNNLYTSYDMIFDDESKGLITKNSKEGLTTTTKFVCEPITCWYGSFLIYSILKCNLINFSQMKYYKIGSDIYYCYGYNFYGGSSIAGTPFLFKVS